MKLEIPLPSPPPNKIDFDDWFSKAFKKLAKSAPPGVSIVLLAHSDAEMSMKGTCCPHETDAMLEAAMSANEDAVAGIPGVCGDPERN